MQSFNNNYFVKLADEIYKQFLKLLDTKSCEVDDSFSLTRKVTKLAGYVLLTSAKGPHASRRKSKLTNPMGWQKESFGQQEGFKWIKIEWKRL
jgi:hypothetical protein